MGRLGLFSYQLGQQSPFEVCKPFFNFGGCYTGLDGSSSPSNYSLMINDSLQLVKLSFKMNEENPTIAFFYLVILTINIIYVPLVL